MKPAKPMPPVFRLARKDGSAQTHQVEAPITSADENATRALVPAKLDHCRRKPRKTSSGGSGRFISRLFGTIAALRRHVAHVERQAEQVAEAAKKRTDGATRMVMEQRTAAEARKNRQTADINRRNAQRTEVRASVLAFAAGATTAEDALRQINRILDLGVDGME